MEVLQVLVLLVSPQSITVGTGTYTHNSSQPYHSHNSNSINVNISINNLNLLISNPNRPGTLNRLFPQHSHNYSKYNHQNPQQYLQQRYTMSVLMPPSLQPQPQPQPQPLNMPPPTMTMNSNLFKLP